MAKKRPRLYIQLIKNAAKIASERVCLFLSPGRIHLVSKTPKKAANFKP